MILSLTTNTCYLICFSYGRETWILPWFRMALPGLHSSPVGSTLHTFTVEVRFSLWLEQDPASWVVCPRKKKVRSGSWMYKHRWSCPDTKLNIFPTLLVIKDHVSLRDVGLESHVSRKDAILQRLLAFPQHPCILSEQRVLGRVQLKDWAPRWVGG